MEDRTKDNITESTIADETGATVLDGLAVLGTDAQENRDSVRDEVRFCFDRSYNRLLLNFRGQAAVVLDHVPMRTVPFDNRSTRKFRVLFAALKRGKTGRTD